MSIRRFWPVAVIPLLALGAASASASVVDPPAEANCTAVGPSISHPTGTSTRITFGATCTSAATVSVTLEVQDAGGGTFALATSTSDVQASGSSNNELLLPVFVPRVCLTVNGQTTCTP